jgi:hypothetical protein
MESKKSVTKKNRLGQQVKKTVENNNLSAIFFRLWESNPGPSLPQVQDDSEAPHVHLLVVAVPKQYLGGDKHGRAHFGLQTGRVYVFGQAEVTHFDYGVRVLGSCLLEQNIRWFEIPMYYVWREE